MPSIIEIKVYFVIFLSKKDAPIVCYISMSLFWEDAIVSW